MGSVHAGGGVTLNLESPATGGGPPGGGVSRSGGVRGGGGKTPETPLLLATQLGAGKESSRCGGHAVWGGAGGGGSRVIQMLHSEAFAAGGPLSARKRRAGWLKVPLFFLTYANVSASGGRMAQGASFFFFGDSLSARKRRGGWLKVPL